MAKVTNVYKNCFEILGMIDNFLDGAIILLFSAIVSVFAIVVVFGIFNKVYQENYKRPWLFIAISTIFLVCAQLSQFFYAFFGYTVINTTYTVFIIYMLEFISITILAYGLLLEYFILKYYKGKFVKMKLIPVQEGTLGGEIDLNVSNGASYLGIKKDRKYLREEFAMATRKGFEGFLITQEFPREIRLKYGIQKTPIAVVAQVNEDQQYKQFLDESSELVDPLQLNKLISFIDNFLEQSQNPFIMLDLDLLVRVNDFSIVSEFLNYIAKRVEKFNGIFICLLNEDTLKDFQISELKQFLNTLE